MRLTLDTNARDISRVVRAVFQDQVPFAISRALNATNRDAQRAERDGLEEGFTLRRKRWAEMNIKIRPEDFATKRKLEAVIRLESPGDGARSDILGKFEEATVKQPRGGKRLAIPADARIGRVTVTRKNQKPRSFDFLHVGGPVWKGNRRTFMVKNPDGTGGIFQRTGRKRTGRRQASDLGTRKVRDLNVRTLFLFTPLAELEKRLDFEEIARETVTEKFERHLVDEFSKAVRTAR